MHLKQLHFFFEQRSRVLFSEVLKHSNTNTTRNEISWFSSSHKVHIFWEGHKNMTKSPKKFWLELNLKKGIFRSFWGLFRIFELYYRKLNRNSNVLLQVNNYEIIINFFHISHILTWYSIVREFTRIYPVCSTYELTKLFV